MLCFCWIFSPLLCAYMFVICFLISSLLLSMHINLLLSIPFPRCVWCARAVVLFLQVRRQIERVMVERVERERDTNADASFHYYSSNALKEPTTNRLLRTESRPFTVSRSPFPITTRKPDHNARHFFSCLTR
ncbi:hypothetical protein BC629DRAFT_113678 [Irpex lacteus]|nr:hypothetical protein BC629DRAFT_113678 [Irpex lacteus]